MQLQQEGPITVGAMDLLEFDDKKIKIQKLG